MIKEHASLALVVYSLVVLTNLASSPAFGLEVRQNRTFSVERGLAMPISIEVYDSVFDEADLLIGPLRLPQIKIRFSSDPNYVASRFDSEIELPVAIEETRFGSVVHEYGHIVFEQNLIAHSEEWSRVHELMDPNRSQLSDHDKLVLSFSSSYHELFADILAVVWSIQPDIMVSTEELDPSSPFRDFSKRKAGLKSWPEAVARQNPHSYFYPTRLAFWDMVKDHINDLKFRQKIISTIFDVLLEDSEKRLTEVFEPMVGTTAKSDNARLIKSLDHALSRLKVELRTSK